MDPSHDREGGANGQREKCTTLSKCGELNRQGDEPYNLGAQAKGKYGVGLREREIDPTKRKRRMGFPVWRT